jgi:peptidoglycan hydrolase-like protein with peptidoglycan-binding domain
VYERLRWKFEVLGFGRPDFKLRPGYKPEKADGQVSIRLENIRPGKRHKDIERVQLALARVTGLRNAKAGSFDGQTQAAYSRWQRKIGLVGKNVTGLPDFDSLSRLGRETGYFRIDA